MSVKFGGHRGRTGRSATLFHESDVGGTRREAIVASLNHERRSSGRRAERAASAVGYVGTEIAKEAPYCAGTFGSALVSDTITSTHALVFLAGANIGAAVDEYSVARLSNVLLERRSLRSSSPGRSHATTIASGGRDPARPDQDGTMMSR